MPFNRLRLKERAKNFLREHYINAFIICLIAAVLGSRSNGLNFNFSIDLTNYYDISDSLRHLVILPGIFGALFTITVSTAFFIIIAIISVVFTFFIVNPLTVSKKHYFIGDNYDSVGDLFYAFRNPYYFNIVKTMFIKDLIIFIGILCLVFPGIYMIYKYRMVDYILAEHPEYETSDVLHLSSEMTQGIKMDIFVLDISFIGWNIVGSLFSGLVNYLLLPYYEATYAQLFMNVKENYGWERYDYYYQDQY